MKGLIYHIKRFALHDGPGIRTTVFFKGCPLRCWWCHNPESQNMHIESFVRKDRLDEEEFTIKEVSGYEIDSDTLFREIIRDKPFMDESKGGITFSGGEPLLQSSFLSEILDKTRAEGITSAIDTSGYCQPEIFQEIAEKSDIFLFDIKHLDDKMHKRYTGVSNKLILHNLNYLHSTDKSTIIRIPLIPKVNDGQYAREIAQWLDTKYPEFREVHLLPYHSIASHKYEKYGLINHMGGLPDMDPDDLIPIMQVFKQQGFNVVIGG